MRTTLVITMLFFAGSCKTPDAAAIANWKRDVAREIANGTLQVDSPATIDVTSWNDATAAIAVALQLVERESPVLAIVLPDDAPSNAFESLASLRRTLPRTEMVITEETAVPEGVFLIRELTVANRRAFVRGVLGPAYRHGVHCGTGYDVRLVQNPDGSWSTSGELTVSQC